MAATHMDTPIGPIAIRPEIIQRNAGMTDRELADQTFKSCNGFIDPEAFAELLHRGLSSPGMFESDTYRLIKQRELKYQMKCPFCGSTELVTNDWHIDNQEVEALECESCKAGAPLKVWENHYAAKSTQQLD